MRITEQEDVNEYLGSPNGTSTLDEEDVALAIEDQRELNLSLCKVINNAKNTMRRTGQQPQPFSQTLIGKRTGACQPDTPLSVPVGLSSLDRYRNHPAAAFSLCAMSAADRPRRRDRSRLSSDPETRVVQPQSSNSSARLTWEVTSVPDVVIRNVSADTLERIDNAAARDGLSRTAYLRKQLDAIATPLVLVTMDDLRRSAELSKSVLDGNRMRGAWD